MKDKHAATLRAKPAIYSCLFWSKLEKCGSNPFWANRHDLTDYFHQKTKSRVELGVAPTKFCFLVEEHTLFNIWSVLLAFFQSVFYQKERVLKFLSGWHFPSFPCSGDCLSLPLPWLFSATNKQYILADVPFLSSMAYIVWAFGWN